MASYSYFYIHFSKCIVVKIWNELNFERTEHREIASRGLNCA